MPRGRNGWNGNLMSCSRLEDIVLKGQIDLWFEEGGELILVDYKSGRDESRSGEYALQLRLYALALLRYAGRLPDRAVLFYLWSENAVEVSLGEKELRAARKEGRGIEGCSGEA